VDDSAVGPRTNIALSVGILVACGLGWLATNALPSGLRVDPLGPAYYPRFVLLGMAALAAALLVASVRDLRRRPEGAAPELADPLPAQAVSADREGEEALPPVSYPRMLAVLGLSFGYVLSLESLGYFIATLLYVVALLLLLRVRNPLAIAGCALGVPLVLDSLFGRLLGIPLPGGVLDRLTFLP
jgi:Tripartite tricarboxylate transporter TctB family